MIRSAGLCTDIPIIKKEVIVDIHCGTAVLRGADVFAPGVMGAHPGEFSQGPLNCITITDVNEYYEIFC